MSKAIPYRCNDCKIFFTVYSKQRGMGCPKCLDTVAVYRHKGRIGVLNPGKRTSWPPEDVEQLKQLLASELFYREIAEIMGRSFSSVRCKINQLRSKEKQK